MRKRDLKQGFENKRPRSAFVIREVHKKSNSVLGDHHINMMDNPGANNK